MNNVYECLNAIGGIFDAVAALTLGLGIWLFETLGRSLATWQKHSRR